MNKKIAAILVALAFVGAVAAQAQKDPVVGLVYQVKAKNPVAFEAGMKKHMEWHRKNADAWAWHSWEILNGHRVGQFYVGSFGHFWKDFDGREQFEKLDTADVVLNVMPHSELVKSSHYVVLTEASSPPSAAPGAMVQLSIYYVKPSMTPEFEDALKEYRQALDKAKWPVRATWYRLASGDEGPQYVLAVDRASWADFAPPEKSMMAVLSETIGPRQATELSQKFRDAIKSVETEVLKYRADLSYVPAAK